MFVIKKIPIDTRLIRQAYLKRNGKLIFFLILMILSHSIINIIVGEITLTSDIIHGKFTTEKLINSFNSFDLWNFGFSLFASLIIVNRYSIDRNIANYDLPNDINPTGKRDQQHQIILAVIDTLDYEPLQIPTNGKARIKGICLKRVRVFTEDGFKRAWQEGLDAGLFRLLENDKFSSK